MYFIGIKIQLHEFLYISTNQFYFLSFEISESITKR